jgi:exopolyphosphatase/guanosine-5'-triphosphate,3'-diphosphate pyrophosphatase
MPNKIFRYAAIDVGSNAVRLLLCNAVEEHDVVHFKKSELVRIPLRLGEDVFLKGIISENKATGFVKTMQAFKLLIDVFGPVSYRACATASLREATNGQELVNRVKKECNLKLEIISGKEEAELIYTNHVEQMLDHTQSYLYIDVGGGSTEITLFDKEKIIASQSFDVGALRWVSGRVSTDTWERMKKWVQEISGGHFPLTAIGSGGNINKIIKMLDRRDKPLSFSKLKDFYEELKAHTVEERMEIWQLNPDRADVIVPAAKIYLAVMKAADIKEIIVPQIGLADGIVHKLHEEFLQKALPEQLRKS